ncbi:BTAD domain-containing putative transcriptional regulator [Streptomyces sp. NBC_01518]|uniref:AfsR/SARP family transcriptional regulator n=1 Tax=Streptomyces sp. NBC_01518 TaxID=2903891 RepID=UPI0038685EA8
MRMQLGVLGPLHAELGGCSIVPTAGKPRQVLALLALRAGRAVPVATLMEELWADSPPRSASTTLQTYILHLRRAIARALPEDCAVSPKDVLGMSFGGYRLTAVVEEHDLNAFEDLALRGAIALEAGDPPVAADLLARALGIWRGPALEDVPRGTVLELEAIGMEETRMQVLEQRITAELRLGRQALLIPELRVLTARHPLNENLSAQLMTAFHRAGSTWRALEEFRRLRRSVGEELGIEPGARLQRLHQSILNGESETGDPGRPSPLLAG